MRCPTCGDVDDGPTCSCGLDGAPEKCSGPSPGPWKIAEGDQPEHWRVLGSDGEMVADVWTDKEWSNQAEIDGRLMAASPDLLAACKAAFAMLAERGNPLVSDDWELGHRLSAAIGKATDPDYPE